TSSPTTSTNTGCLPGYLFSTIDGHPCNTTQTSTQPSTSTTYNFGPINLIFGSRGDAVKELQRYFNDTLHLNLVIDGILGRNTIAIVKQWQQDHNLTPDGIIGPMTKAMMEK
ncbi:MAG: peptidoglycan-binding protein, partial [Patescibacteria group bacterium]|nr:peptidoglycan-binding protein [Patescibacteria group bacterium]